MAPRTTSQDPERQLMIKTKACQRLAKEVSYYQEEVKENEAKLQKMKEEKRDVYDIKKFQEVLDESHMMIPDSKSRFDASMEELSLLVDDYDKKEEASEWYTTAKALLEEHNFKTTSDVTETNVDDLAEGEAF